MALLAVGIQGSTIVAAAMGGAVKFGSTVQAHPSVLVMALYTFDPLGSHEPGTLELDQLATSSTPHVFH
jgi:hypothetical protein